MERIAKYNDGNKYGLLVIDVFSKYTWIKMLKTKKPEEVARAFADILEQGRRPKAIRSDIGGEFSGRPFKELLKREQIKHLYAYSSKKAAVAERCIKTIKLKIYKYITAEQNYRYVDALPDLVQSYNATVHSSIGRPPKDVNAENESEVRLDAYLRRKHEKKNFKYEVRDTVKISNWRGVFAREYDERWSNEIFKINDRHNKSGVPMYGLVDWADEEVTGRFYEEELQKVVVNEDTMYRIDKILRRRTRDNRKEVLVKWYGWGDQFNSWIPVSEVQ